MAGSLIEYHCCSWWMRSNVANGYGCRPLLLLALGKWGSIKVISSACQGKLRFPLRVKLFTFGLFIGGGEFGIQEAEHIVVHQSNLTCFHSPLFSR
jgi:hypothetical protein